jgi:hypothetical protein
MNYLYVSSPALANVATRLITRQGWGDLWLRPKFRRGWPYYLAVWLLPFLAAIVGSLAYHLVFPQSFDPNITRGRSLLAGLPVAADPNAWKVMLFLALNLMIVEGLLTGNVLSLLEEFGWRPTFCGDWWIASAAGTPRGSAPRMWKAQPPARPRGWSVWSTVCGTGRSSSWEWAWRAEVSE